MEVPKPVVSLKGTFNTDIIPRAMNFPKNGSQITLEDYILSQPNGVDKEFHTCSEVLGFPEADTIPSEYYFYRRYSIECYGAQKFLEGQSSKDTFFSMSLIDMWPNFPATLTPKTGELGGRKTLKEKKLTEAFTGLIPIEKSQTSISVIIDDAEVEYDILGRKDVNGDGHEDVLLIMTHHIIEASSRGTTLFALSKTSKNGNIHVLWDYK